MMSIRRRWWIAAGALALAAICVLAWRAGQTDPRPGATRSASSSAQAARPISSPRSAAASSTEPPHSLRGTAPDGGVRFDSNGRAVADEELRRLFDWYLAALGEQDPATIRARLQRDLALRMTPAQASDVLSIFDRYVDYQRASTRLAGIDDLRARLDAVHALRVRMLGEAAADGFFGEEETEARRVLALQEMQADPPADPAQAAARRTALDAASPGYAQARDDATLRTRIGELDAQLDRDGASAAERHAERSALLGPDAADRFADLDAQRAQWQTRVDAYARQRAALARRSDLSAAQRNNETQRLLLGFSVAERRRIAALDEAGLVR